jgi:predicted metal-dependent phosphoesterase TrpH
MIIDLHFHTKKFSSCSRIPLKEGVERAAAMGLDAICLTEHDIFADYPQVPSLEKDYGIRIFRAVEIYTLEGDILCFGLDRIPSLPVSAVDLLTILKHKGGASIAAHPFRRNNRGIGDLLASLPDLTAVEAWNGNTCRENNLKALKLARMTGLPVTGSSDSHRLERIGCFATEFSQKISSEKDLVLALKGGEYQPVSYSFDKERFIPAD